LPKRVAAKAAKMAFECVAHDMEAATGGRMGTRQIEESVLAAAQDFDAFYAQPCPEEIEQHTAAKPMQVLTFDGKGGVMRQEALRQETVSAPKPAPRKRPKDLWKATKVWLPCAAPKVAQWVADQTSQLL
jgi:hypothetical protein